MFVKFFNKRRLWIVLAAVGIACCSCGLIDDLESDDKKKNPPSAEPKALTEIIPVSWDGKTDWEDSLWLFKNTTL